MGGGEQLFRVRAATVLKTGLVGVRPVERTASERDRIPPLGIGNSLDHERSPLAVARASVMSERPSPDGQSLQDASIREISPRRPDWLADDPGKFPVLAELTGRFLASP